MTENTIPAVEKTIALVTILGNAALPVSRTELEKRLSISSSTCYRILQTLIRADWVRKTSTGRFQLAGGLITSARNLWEMPSRFERLQVVLNDLSQETGLGCKLSIRSGDHYLTVLRAESDRKIQVSGRTGAEFPLPEGTVGTALLADDSKESIYEICARCREDIPERDPETVLQNLRKMRRSGFAGSGEPGRWQVCAASVPVRDGSGEIAAALTLIGFQEEFAEKRLKEFGAILRKYADICTEKLK